MFADIANTHDNWMAWFTHIIRHQTSKGVKGHFRLCGLDVFLRDFLRINTPMMQRRCLM